MSPRFNERKAFIVPWIFILALAVYIYPVRSSAAQPGESVGVRAADTLVLINIFSETRDSQEILLLDGRRIKGYSPEVINVFPSTGVVLDDKPHIMTFLGYRWVDIQTPDPRIEIITSRGERHRGKMVGIDQSLGVAVVVSTEDIHLERTPTCTVCEVKPSSTVLYPVISEMRLGQFERARIISVGAGQSRSGWTITYNPRNSGSERPLIGTEHDVLGLPILNEEHQFLGFMANQRPSASDPMDLRRTLYLMPQLITSAQKIMEAGGHVRTGWLGVYIDDLTSSGIRIYKLDEGGPAQKAGLLPGDMLLKYDNHQITDSWQLIRMVQDTTIGSDVAIELSRNGQTMTRVARIEARKPMRVREKLVFGLPPSSIQLQPLSVYGIECIPLTHQLADFLQQPVQDGLLVSNVDELKAFYEAGVRTGDIILSLNQQPLSDLKNFFIQIRNQGSSPMVIRLLRKGKEQSVVVQIPEED